jgi:hypothetical protein
MIADIDTLRHQTAVLGPVASPPTVWLSLDEVTPAALRRVEKVRAKVRRHVWSQMSGLPASKVAGTDLGETIVLDVDATLVERIRRRSRRQPRSSTGSGFIPSGCGATTRTSYSRSCCGPATRAAITPGTTSRCWAERSHRSPHSIAGIC